jgi:hypothetical protein
MCSREEITRGNYPVFQKVLYEGTVRLFIRDRTALYKITNISLRLVHMIYK